MNKSIKLLFHFLKNFDYYSNFIKKPGLYISYPMYQKNNKIRWIDAPSEELKKIQKKILLYLLNEAKIHPCAVGFVKNKNVLDGAKEHLNQKVILNIDLKDFFHSITISDVSTIFSNIITYYNKKYNLNLTNIKKIKLIYILTLLCTYNNYLPQGAPTSPALSNIFLYNLDKIINYYAINKGLKYTRYADDLTISSSAKETDMKLILHDILKIIKGHSNKLKVNTKKIKIYRPHRRMIVTGVVVNEKLGVPKYKWKNLRAYLHNIYVKKLNITENELKKIRGKIEWIKSIDKNKGNKLYNQYLKILTIYGNKQFN